MALGTNARAWTNNASWVNKFKQFSQRMTRKEGCAFNMQHCLASTSLCRQFIVLVANEKLGFSRPAAARRALSKERAKFGFPSLSEDQAISKLIRGVENSTPRTVRQSEGLDIRQVKKIVHGWGFNADWWLHQTATMIVVAFLCLFRLGELRTLREESIHVVFRDGLELPVTHVALPMSMGSVKTLLLHIPWRKTHQSKDCWVVLACPRAIQMLVHQLFFRRSGRDQQQIRTGSLFVFPSRSRSKFNGVRVPSQKNPVGHLQFVKAMQQALVMTTGLAPISAVLRKGHALRVGGSNYMRSLGIEDDVHRRLGGWMSLVSSRGYMSMSIDDRVEARASMGI